MGFNSVYFILLRKLHKAKLSIAEQGLRLSFARDGCRRHELCRRSLWRPVLVGTPRQVRNNSILSRQAPSSLKIILLTFTLNQMRTKSHRQGIQHRSNTRTPIYFFFVKLSLGYQCLFRGVEKRRLPSFEEEEYICSCSKLQYWPSVPILFLGGKTTVIPT